MEDLALLLEVTPQQAYKYERGINRISASRLFALARTLGVDVGYFYEGFGGGSATPLPRQQRLLLEFVRSFAAIKNQRQQELLCHLARLLSRGERSQAV